MAVFFDSARVQTGSSLTNILSGWTRNDSLERSWPGGSRFAARFEGKPAPQSNIRRSEASLTERGSIMALGFRCGRGLVGGKWELSLRGRLWGGHHLKSPASLSLSSALKSESESLFLPSCLLRMLKERRLDSVTRTIEIAPVLGSASRCPTGPTTKLPASSLMGEHRGVGNVGCVRRVGPANPRRGFWVSGAAAWRCKERPVLVARSGSMMGNASNGLETLNASACR